ncbi:MAG: nucleotidyltransferase domain-containing protein, partial [Gemmatimonadetes bacterium]|nr:nucleotidyltransferase domain-containing protein [Gemmatimonadota bacterium]
MPKPSSNSARVTFLDVPATVERIRRAAQGLCAANPHVTAVVLFGSLADASATPSSDADLLVVLREDSRRVIDRVPDYSRAFEDLGLAA